MEIKYSQIRVGQKVSWCTKKRRIVATAYYFIAPNVLPYGFLEPSATKMFDDVRRDHMSIIFKEVLNSGTILWHRPRKSERFESDDRQLSLNLPDRKPTQKPVAPHEDVKDFKDKIQIFDMALRLMEASKQNYNFDHAVNAVKKFLR